METLNPIVENQEPAAVIIPVITDLDYLGVKAAEIIRNFREQITALSVDAKTQMTFLLQGGLDINTKTIGNLVLTYSSYGVFTLSYRKRKTARPVTEVMTDPMLVMERIVELTRYERR